MSARWLLIAIFAGLVAGTAVSAQGFFDFFVYSFVDAKPRDALKPYSDVNCNSTGATTRCKVQVNASYNAGTRVCTVEAPNIYFDRSDRNFILVWVPPSADFKFCPIQGDGVSFKDAKATVDEQFDDAWAIENGESPAGDNPMYKKKDCFNRYRILALNTPAKSGEQYDYGIQFRHMPSGAKCALDPFIKNG